MAKHDQLSGWSCDGQEDLLDLVETEHIPGGMPIEPDAHDQARQAYYASLPQLTEVFDG